MPDRPNILYVFTDQQSAFAMSCMGSTDLDTPNMDRLATEGVLFRTAYCPQPLCTPCRGSMFTGMSPHECGTAGNGLPILPQHRPHELGNLLSDSGYTCLYGGKWHVPEGSMPRNNDHGFEVYCGFNDAQLADTAADALAKAARDSKPFFMVASFDNPHNICEYGRNMALPWGPLDDPPPVKDCPNLPANFTPAPFEPEILRIEREAHWAIYPYTVNHTPDDWRRLRWAYFRLVEKVDREIGKILDALDQHGLASNTLVVFSSDHGEGHGAHQWNQKSGLIEEVVRVPFVIRDPKGRSGAVDTDSLVVNGLDLLPTVCDYAGIAPPSGLSGHSLRPIVQGRAACLERRAAFMETLFDGGRGYDTVGRAVRTTSHKYVVYDRGKYREQLFDLDSDPGEMVNLAVESRHRNVLDEHRQLLQDYVTETADTFKVPGHWKGRA